jgi:cytochrome c-type biogenesis protein
MIMSLTPVSLLAAFGAGLLSFLSPCVLPLLPGYLAYLAGTNLTEAQRQSILRWRVTLHALWFVLGSAMILMMLGAFAALFGSALSTYQQTVEHIGGLLLILFGIVLSGLLPIPWLSETYQVQVKPARSTWWRSGLIGLTFGASWSACAGPILATILVVTMVKALGVLQGVLVMLVFAAGQGIPLVLVALLVDRASTFLRRLRRSTTFLSYIASAVLIFVGVSLLFGLFSTTG